MSAGDSTQDTARVKKPGPIRGSGNVFRDLGHKGPDVEKFKTKLAAEIIQALNREGLTVRAAHGRTGIAAADFSRIRNANLGRFTVERLMSILNRLGSRVEFNMRVLRRETVAHESDHLAQESEAGTSDDQMPDKTDTKITKHRYRKGERAQRFVAPPETQPERIKPKIRRRK